MSRRTRLGFESVEDDEVSAEEGAGEITERPEESVETQLVETKEGEADEAVATADGEQLAEDLRDVIEQAEVVIASLEEGGMSESAARSTEIAVEAIANRWNIKRKKLGVENFQGSSRLNATRLGLEGIMDTVGGVFKRVYEWILKRISDLRAIWDKYVNVGKSAKGRIEKLRKKVRELRGSAKGETLAAGTGWQLMPLVDTTGNKVNSILGISKTDKFATAMNALDVACGWYLDSAGELITKQAVTSNASTPKPADIEIVTSRGNDTKLSKLFPASANKEGRRIVPMPGGAVLYYVDGDGNQRWQWADVTASTYKEFEPEVPEVSEMTDGLDKAFDAAVSLNQYYQKRRKTVTEMEKLKTKITKAKEQFGKAFDKKDVDSSKLVDKRKAVEVAKANFENAVEMDVIYRKSATAYIQANISVVQASLKKYTVED